MDPTLAWLLKALGRDAIRRGAVTSPLRTSSIKTIMRSAQHDFDEKQLTNEDGKSFGKFSDFIRAAADRGLVRIVGKGIRMEVHPNGRLTPEAAVPTDSASDILPEEPGQAADGDQPPTDQPDTISKELVEPENAAAPSDEGEVVHDSVSDSTNILEDETDFVSDYRLRVLVVDALRNCEYPAPAHMIGKHCIEASERRNISLPNRRLNQLLTNARTMGLLVESASDGAEIQEYTFVENPQQIKLFLESESI